MDDRRFDDAARAIGGATSRRGALAALAAIAAAVPLGAGANNGQDDRPDREGRPGSAKKKKKKCTPSKCPAGCCSGKTCKPGTAVDACGTGGAACAACAAGEVCIGGACVAECSPANCWGCCDPATNACRGGLSPDACGTAGAACTACAGNAPCCVAGACAFGAWANATTFGSGPGGAADELSGPLAVAVDADGRTALAADTGNTRMSMWRGSGTPAAWSPGATFGVAGPLPNQFSAPLGVALAGDGLTAWIADGGNQRVAVWVRPGAASDAWAVAATFGTAGPGLDQFVTPWGVAVSPDLLTAWVSDVGASRVSVWTRPNVDSNAWTWQASFGGGPGPGANELLNPTGLAVTADGQTVAIADGGNSRISVWTRPTATSVVWSNQATFGGFGPGPDQFDQPRGVAFADGGRTVLVSDPFRNRASMWTRPTASSAAWTFATTFGSLGAGASEFSFPAGIATVADGRAAWIADTGNNRISVWEATCP